MVTTIALVIHSSISQPIYLGLGLYRLNCLMLCRYLSLYCKYPSLYLYLVGNICPSSPFTIARFDKCTYNPDHIHIMVSWFVS